MKCAVIGLGEFGRAAAIGLSQNGAEVIAVDNNMDRVNAVKDHVALAVRLDASQEHAMNAHGLADVDVLIAAIGANFEAQVLTVVHAKRCGIKKIVARATTPDHHRVLVAVGADEVFNPEEEAARWMVQRLLITNISSYFELAEGFSVVEVNAPPGVVGKSLSQLELRRRFRLNLVAIKRMVALGSGEKVLKSINPVPSPDEVIQPDDVLALVGSVIDLANFMGEYGQ
ncbi:MAG TPA: TrkA family potassium uptake protein [Verrucomicrobia bacterium]|nr:TrkA family potassium uptake protein [Verrucomicrobiota bacterium]HOB34027.1 TrkA family potassium uptake protein [Verrucomicrobiota bacterium]HOP99055.1 TrkA family potassium uptake protein [Verrucomicrobiota bacterium]